MKGTPVSIEPHSTTLWPLFDLLRGDIASPALASREPEVKADAEAAHAGQVESEHGLHVPAKRAREKQKQRKSNNENKRRQRRKDECRQFLKKGKGGGVGA